jgi:uncharacterized membrane protein YgdD (TMEM256/DUF423 family)
MTAFIRIGAIAGFLGVGLGAFGAHGLLAVFETGVRYQLVHALALLVVGVLIGRRSTKILAAAGWCFAAGIILFCGSLYVLALTGTTAAGIVTPFGGLLFLAGWLCLAFTA